MELRVKKMSVDTRELYTLIGTWERRIAAAKGILDGLAGAHQLRKELGAEAPVFCWTEVGVPHDAGPGPKLAEGTEPVSSTPAEDAFWERAETRIAAEIKARRAAAQATGKKSWADAMNACLPEYLRKLEQEQRRANLDAAEAAIPQMVAAGPAQAREMAGEMKAGGWSLPAGPYVPESSRVAKLHGTFATTTPATPTVPGQTRRVCECCGQAYPVPNLGQPSKE